MIRKSTILVLCIIMIFSNMAYCDNELPITFEELGNPQYLNVEFIDNSFLIKWTNNTKAFLQSGNYRLDYQIDYKEGRSDWVSANPKLNFPTYTLWPEDVINGKSYIKFDPIKEHVSNEGINLNENSYSIRIRYRYAYILDGVEKHIYGSFSSPVILGVMPDYRNSSDWAIEELDKASDLGLITEEIKNNMKANITREEFCQVLIRMYENYIIFPIETSENPFKDTNNIAVLKAAKLGIVKGVGENNFDPNAPVTRQEMSVMVYRTIRLLNPTMDFNLKSTHKFSDDEYISVWAIDPIQFIFDRGILKGTGDGNINPLGNATREGAVILILRAYELLK